MEALELLRKRQELGPQFDLVLSDVHMPDMDGFKLLEAIGLELGVPVIMMSSDGDTNVVLRGVTHGAVDFLIKPVRIEELRNVWQHVVRRRSLQLTRPGEETDGDSRNNASASQTHGMKRKDTESLRVEHEGGGAGKKPRVVWSVEMHQQFVNAVNVLGIDKAVPKRILELMNVEGLTRENVASHLQKYRLYLKRVEGVQLGKGGKMPRPPAVETASRERIDHVPQQGSHLTNSPEGFTGTNGYSYGKNASTSGYQNVHEPNSNFGVNSAWHQTSSPGIHSYQSGYLPGVAHNGINRSNFHDYSHINSMPGGPSSHPIGNFGLPSHPSDSQLYSAFSGERPPNTAMGRASSLPATVQSFDHYNTTNVENQGPVSPVMPTLNQFRASSEVNGCVSMSRNGNASAHGSSNGQLVGIGGNGVQNRSSPNNNNDVGILGSTSATNAGIGTDRDTPSDGGIPSPVLHDNPSHFVGGLFDGHAEATTAENRKDGVDSDLLNNERANRIHKDFRNKNFDSHNIMHGQQNASHMDSMLPSLIIGGGLHNEMEGIQGLNHEQLPSRDDPESEFINMLIESMSGTSNAMDLAIGRTINDHRRGR